MPEFKRLPMSSRTSAEVSAVLTEMRSDLIGVYLHGSAVLGGFDADSSDVDVLAVVAGQGTERDQRALGAAVVETTSRCPGTGLEMSVITAATAADIGSCPFEVHIRTTATGTAVIPGAGHAGDADLILHCAVCRDHALAVWGPPAQEVFAPVPADRVRAAMVSELRWALDRASATYAVLNACRALRFAADGQLCSKLDGGRWYQDPHRNDAVVTAAIAHQRDGLPGPTASAATAFVAAPIQEAARTDQALRSAPEGRI
ncbi:aminoglycoside adenylyltransferase domain-containing protein [Streptomyces sp. NPDC002403]